MLRSFTSIRFKLMVGIRGDAPSPNHDIRLGDVVVSSPVDRTGGVIHYEFGKTIQNQKFERAGALNAPPAVLLTALREALQPLVPRPAKRPKVRWGRIGKTRGSRTALFHTQQRLCQKQSALAFASLADLTL